MTNRLGRPKLFTFYPHSGGLAGESDSRPSEMTDVHDNKTRSFNMSGIRSMDTGPAMLVRKFLFVKGFRYKLYDKTLPGKPDLVFPKYKTVIFIHGCFWHGHEGL